MQARCAKIPLHRRWHTVDCAQGSALERVAIGRESQTTAFKWRMTQAERLYSGALLTLGNNIHERQVSGGRLAARYGLDEAQRSRLARNNLRNSRPKLAKLTS